MNSLLKSVHSLSNKKNSLIRESLQCQLNTSVMEMQSAQSVLDGEPVGNCDESMTLCFTLEALFLHGLKDSLLNRVTEAISGPDFDAMPQPSFWGPLLVFSHRQIINQITALSQITTEVGYCRAWIRLALNEGLLASYFSAIRRENSALKPYYNRAAFIRDVDLVEVAQKHIESLDYIRFEFACNTSLLNFWSTTPLLMAAIWSPPMKSCPVNSAVDIAKTINSDQADVVEEIDTVSSIRSYGSFNSSHSALNRFGGATEDDALNIILSNKSYPNRPTEENGMQERQELERDSDPKDSNEEDNVTEVLNESRILESETVMEDDNKDKSTVNPSTTGNSLIGKLGWSSSLDDSENSAMVSSQISNQEAPQTPGEGITYDSLIQNYQTAGCLKSPDINEFLSKYSQAESINTESESRPIKKETESMAEMLGKIQRERGLDTQNYSCLNCGHLIGLTFAKACVCNFSGNYFCGKCMAIEQFLIPSRIIHNWDLNRYPVSQRAANYLSNCNDLVDLKVLNPQIYTAVDCMAQLKSLRIQLNLLCAYLFTCREPIIDSLQKKVSPRDYLYEHVHKYSVTDLIDAPSGLLAQQLLKIVEFAKNHVLNCWLCSQKGFICEICTNPQVIYPFHLKSTYRCQACNAVFHADCLNASKPCPKCERRRKRTDLPLLDLAQADVVTEKNATSPICIK